MDEKRIIVNNTVVGEYIGGALQIAFRVNGHMRVYLITNGPDGLRMTVTIRRVTEEVPLPKLSEVVR